MKPNNNKTKTTVCLSLLLIVSMLIVASPALITNAQTVARDNTLLIAVSPNPVGLGQSMIIYCWGAIYPSEYAPNVPGQTGAAAYARFHNFTFTITKPDGTIETKIFPETDPLGSAYFNYVPSQVGTYTVICKYPGESFPNQTRTSNNIPTNAIFNPVQSKTISFVVQTSQVAQWPDNPLPTGYWSRPIDASNRFWGSIAGNWLDFSQGQDYGYNYWTNFAPYTQAPNTAHIVWTKVFQQGGLVGGENGVDDYYTGESYQMKFKPIVMDGRLYYNLRVGSTTDRGYACVDIRTGKELFRRNDTTLTGGFCFSLQWEDAHGTIDFLIGSPVGYTTGLGTTMNFYDPLNGERCFTIENVTGGGATIMNNTGGAGNTNDMNQYILSGNQLIDWSFFKCVQPRTGFSWAPSATTNYNWAAGIVYNVTIPKPANSGSYAIGTGGGLVDGNMVVARSANTTDWPPTLYLVGIRCTDGQVMWTSNTSLLWNPAAGGWRGGGGVALSSDGGVYLNYKQETMQVIGWDLTTGAVKYTTVPRNGSDWGMYTSGWSMDTAYGKFYVGAYDGYMMAYDIKTGQLLWQYSSGNSGLETPYGTWPFFLGIPYGMTIADGKVFAATGEHSPNDPLYRGEALHVIDANTGKGVWTLQGWWTGNAIADGYYVGYNGYDGEIYSVGRGLSATTVQAPMTSITAGDQITISGTVTDQSPGQTCLGIPAAGTPAIADEFMTPWMQYLYMQDQMPANATGVPVQLVAIDSSGASTTIGTVTSDISGFFNTNWAVPTTPGAYKIIANFAGTNSYYSSSAIAAITVVAATPTSTPLTASDVASQVVSQLPTPVPATPAPTIPSASEVATQVVSQLPAVSNTDMAIIVVVVIGLLIGLVNLVLMLRKK